MVGQSHKPSESWAPGQSRFQDPRKIFLLPPIFPERMQIHPVTPSPSQRVNQEGLCCHLVKCSPVLAAHGNPLERFKIMNARARSIHQNLCGWGLGIFGFQSSPGESKERPGFESSGSQTNVPCESPGGWLKGIAGPTLSFSDSVGMSLTISISSTFPGDGDLLVLGKALILSKLYVEFRNSAERGSSGDTESWWLGVLGLHGPPCPGFLFPTQQLTDQQSLPGPFLCPLCPEPPLAQAPLSP